MRKRKKNAKITLGEKENLAHSAEAFMWEI
jgi:hypothetical protein